MVYARGAVQPDLERFASEGFTHTWGRRRSRCNRRADWRQRVGEQVQTMSMTGKTGWGSPWLTVGEVARHLRVSRDTVERWIHSGNLRAVDIGGRSSLISRRRCWRIPTESLEAFLDGRASLPLRPSPAKARIPPREGVIEFIK